MNVIVFPHMRSVAIKALAALSLVAVFCALLCSCGGAPVPAKHGAHPDLTEATVVRVVDGDTIVVALDGSEQKLRLIGIDAPESVHPDEDRNTDEGAVASAHLKEILPAGTRVWLQSDTSDTDKYGRLLRYVWLEAPDDPFSFDEISGKMLNAVLVRDGYAVAKRYEPDTLYAEELERCAI